MDSAGCAYVTGWTAAADFPVEKPLQQYGGGQGDAFVFKLNTLGDTLVYSTFLGGSFLDQGQGIAVKEDTVYVTGLTDSSDYHVSSNPYQSHNGGAADCFVAKLSFNGASLSLGYSTYLGGSQDDWGNGIAIDSLGNAYVAGETWSRNFPATYKPGSSGSDSAFVAKFNSEGRLQYSVRLGGSKANAGTAVAVDSSRNAYVTGYTNSGTGFPRTNALAAQATGSSAGKAAAAAKSVGSHINFDAFVTKINPDGKGLVYSVLLGGSNDDYGYGIAVDSSGCAYVTGGTESSDFPLKNQVRERGVGWDAFVTKVNQTGKDLVFSTCQETRMN